MSDLISHKQKCASRYKRYCDGFVVNKYDAARVRDRSEKIDKEVMEEFAKTLFPHSKDRTTRVNVAKAIAAHVEEALRMEYGGSKVFTEERISDADAFPGIMFQSSPMNAKLVETAWERSPASPRAVETPLPDPDFDKWLNARAGERTVCVDLRGGDYMVKCFSEGYYMLNGCDILYVKQENPGFVVVQHGEFEKHPETWSIRLVCGSNAVGRVLLAFAIRAIQSLTKSLDPRGPPCDIVLGLVDSDVHDASLDVKQVLNSERSRAVYEAFGFVKLNSDTPDDALYMTSYACTNSRGLAPMILRAVDDEKYMHILEATIVAYHRRAERLASDTYADLLSRKWTVTNEGEKGHRYGMSGDRLPLSKAQNEAPAHPEYLCNMCQHHTQPTSSAAGDCWILCDFCDEWDHLECVKSFVKELHSSKPCGGAVIDADGTIVARVGVRTFYVKCGRHV